MPNARPTPGLRLTPEKREQLRRLTEAVEHGTAPVITHEADLAARAFREIERLRRERETLVAAVMAQRERNEHIAECEQCDYELCPVGGELSYRAKRILDAAISLLDGEQGGGGA